VGSSLSGLLHLQFPQLSVLSFSIFHTFNLHKGHDP
jgi:hypothetical protein